MQSYHKVVLFTSLAVRYFQLAERIVASLPDPPSGHEPWRCHEIARVVARCFGMSVVDGTFGSVDHSWIVLPTSCDCAILDVYAIGLPQVQLLATHFLLPHVRNYVDGPERTDIKWDVIEHLENSR